MKKKKKGSSLVLVLIFALFFTAISGVVVSAVVSTTRGNSAQEVWEDTYYAAESAIETAIIKASNGGFDSIEEQPLDGVYNPAKVYEMTYLQYSEFPTCDRFENTTISVKVTKSGDKNAAGDKYINSYYLIESTAKNTERNQERVINATIAKKMGSGDIFKYMICGKGVYVNVGGAADMDPINSTDFDASITIEGGAALNPNERADFTIPKFNFNTMSSHEINGTVTDSAFKVLFDKKDSTGSNGVFHFKTPATRFSNSEVDVYLVNMPSSNMNLKINCGSDGFSNAIIITNGNIELNITGTTEITYGSIIGNEIKTSGTGSMSLKIPPYGSPQSRLSDSDLVELNRKIAMYADNWNVSESVGGSSNYWDTIEYR